MKGAVIKAVAEFAEVITGGTPSTTKPEYWDGDVPWLNSGSLNEGVITAPSKFITQLGLANSSAKLMPKDTVLVALTGATTGQVGYLAIEASANQSVTGILPSKEHHPKYLYFFLKSQRQKMLGDAFGGAQPHINQKYIKHFKVPLPQLDDQIRIAHLLGKVEGLIAQRKQHLQQLDDLLKSVFLKMFGDPVRNERGWEPRIIGTSVEIQSGQVDPREAPYSEMLHVGGANIETESGRLINLQQAMFENLISGKYFFDQNFILYSKIRPYLNKVAKPDFEGICSADIYPIKSIGGVMNRDFLRQLLMSKAFLKYAANNSDRANIPKINRKALEAYSFNCPPVDVQNQFARIVEKVEGIKSHYQQSLTDLENLYGELSQQAFKGELDLSRVPLPPDNDELRP